MIRAGMVAAFCADSDETDPRIHRERFLAMGIVVPVRMFISDHRFVRPLLSAAVAFGIALAANAATFSDNTFNNSDWTLFFEASGSGSSVAAQSTDTGNPPNSWFVQNHSVEDDI